MSDVEPYCPLDVRRGLEHEVACATCKVEDSIRRRELSEMNQTLFPATVLSVRKESCDEVVAIGNRGKQAPDVPAFAFSRGNL